MTRYTSPRWPTLSPVFRSWILTAVLVLAAGAPAAVAQTAEPSPAPQVDDPCFRGRELYLASRFLEARTALMECLATGQEEVEVLLPLAVMAVREGRLDEGIEFSRRAVAVAPSDPEARYWYGRALLRADRPLEARQQWEQGLAQSADHPGILEGLARLSLAAGETAKAYNLLVRLQMLGIDDAWLHALLAEIAAGKGIWGQALQHAEDAMARGEPNTDDLLFAAELAILSGQPERAVDYGRRAVTLEPGARTRGALGETFFAIEEIDSAQVYLRRAVAEPGSNPRHRFNLANVLEVAGHYEEAGEHFRGFLAEQPDDAVGHFNYGVHLDKLGRREDAMREVSRAIELRPDMLSAYVVMAQMLENRGAWDEALQVVAELKVRDQENLAELTAWEDRLLAAQAEAAAAANEGKIRLLHLVVGDEETLALVQDDLAAGENFAAVVMRYSTGPAAARGGDIGWVRPADMVPEMRTLVENLATNEISPPLEAGGLYHMFKRVP